MHKWLCLSSAKDKSQRIRVLFGTSHVQTHLTTSTHHAVTTKYCQKYYTLDPMDGNDVGYNGEIVLRVCRLCLPS